MNKVIVFLLALFFFVQQIEAQTLSEQEESIKMTQAFELSKADKNAEALELFLLVGENTKQQRSEAERQKYVCSQTMACMCYESLKQYKEGYLLAKSLLQGRLNDNERKDVGSFYAMNGYFYALGFIQHNVDGKTDYERGRSILEEIKPYASERLLKLLLPKIPLLWYFEGSEYAITQKHKEALAAYDKALNGFRELGKEAEMIATLKGIAACQYNLYDIQSSDDNYQKALSLAKKNGKASTQMDILQELWSHSSAVGNFAQARIYAASMDSLMESTADKKTKFIYYNKKGKEARGQGLYNLAEQWFQKGMAIAEGEPTDAFRI